MRDCDLFRFAPFSTRWTWLSLLLRLCEARSKLWILVSFLSNRAPRKVQWFLWRMRNREHEGNRRRVGLRGKYWTLHRGERERTKIKVFARVRGDRGRERERKWRRTTPCCDDPLPWRLPLRGESTTPFRQCFRSWDPCDSRGCVNYSREPLPPLELKTLGAI